MGSISPLQAGKLGLARFMAGVVDLVAAADHWREEGVDKMLQLVRPEAYDKDSTECITKVNKLF